MKENIPAHIVEKVTRLEEENTKYTMIIEELRSHMTTTTTKVSGVSEEEHYARLGERDFRAIILLEEINRLNHKVVEVRNHLENAENYIQELQQTITQGENVVSTDIEEQIRYLSQ